MFSRIGRLVLIAWMSILVMTTLSACNRPDLGKALPAPEPTSAVVPAQAVQEATSTPIPAPPAPVQQVQAVPTAVIIPATAAPEQPSQPAPAPTQDLEQLLRQQNYQLGEIIQIQNWSRWEVRGTNPFYADSAWISGCLPQQPYAPVNSTIGEMTAYKVRVLIQVMGAQIYVLEQDAPDWCAANDVKLGDKYWFRTLSTDPTRVCTNVDCLKKHFK